MSLISETYDLQYHKKHLVKFSRGYYDSNIDYNIIL